MSPLKVYSRFAPSCPPQIHFLSFLVLGRVTAGDRITQAPSPCGFWLGWPMGPLPGDLRASREEHGDISSLVQPHTTGQWLRLYSLVPLKVALPQLSSHWAPFGSATLDANSCLLSQVPGHLAIPAGSFHPAHFTVSCPAINCLILFFS